jgi:hypothetical protein
MNHQYKFEDFQKHLVDLRGRPQSKANGDLEGAFFRDFGRAKNYFEEFYSFPESADKLSTFMVAAMHVDERLEDYDTELFGIRHDTGIWVSEALLRGVHWYFAGRPRSDWGSTDQAVVEIKSYAREWIANHPENEYGEQVVTSSGP